jgi:hypothetical protein
MKSGEEKMEYYKGHDAKLGEMKVNKMDKGKKVKVKIKDGRCQNNKVPPFGEIWRKKPKEKKTRR